MIKRFLHFGITLTYYLFYLLPIDCYFGAKGFFKICKEVEHDGNIDFGSKICVFASYTISGRLSRNLKKYLSNLYSVHNYSIIFISSVPLVPEEIEWLKPLCSRIIIRENFGRDFGSYKLGMQKYKHHIIKANELLIANDSVIQIADLTKMFDEMHSRNVDFWGSAEAYGNGLYRKHHVCSYFIVLSKKVIESEVFWNFWKNYTLSASRIHSIEFGEINFSLVLQKAGFTMSSYINATNLLKFLSTKEVNLKPFLNSWIVENSNIVNSSTISRLLYTVNHIGMFLKPMIALGIPIIKKDIFSRCCYYVDEIAHLLKNNGVVDSDEIIKELLGQIKPIDTTKEKILKFIGEK